jgi:mannose-1-phosphate guanylyltransferase/mannose-6-phosphate isomerase
VALDGGAVIELDGQTLHPQKGQEIWLPKGSVHRLSCSVSSPAPARVLEISLGHFDENDIERIEDSYGRA